MSEIKLIFILQNNVSDWNNFFFLYEAIRTNWTEISSFYVSYKVNMYRGQWFIYRPNNDSVAEDDVQKGKKFYKNVDQYYHHPSMD